MLQEYQIKYSGWNQNFTYVNHDLKTFEFTIFFRKRISYEYLIFWHNGLEKNLKNANRYTHDIFQSFCQVSVRWWLFMFLIKEFRLFVLL